MGAAGSMFVGEVDLRYDEMVEWFYPTSTSLLPVTVALGRFFTNNSWGALSFLGGLKEFPYWYLGTPFAYLAGPVVPMLLKWANLMGMGYFTGSLFLVVTNIVGGAIGVGVLTDWLQQSGGKPKTRQKKRRAGGAATLLFLINPWLWVSGWGLAEGSRTMGWMLVPWGLVVGMSWLEKPTKVKGIILGFLLALIIFTNTFSYFVLLVGWGLWAGIRGWREAREKINEAGDKERDFNFQFLAQVAGWGGGGIILSLAWYGPGYWGNLIFGGASIGGKPLYLAALWVGNWLKIVLPVVLAGWVVLRKERKKRGEAEDWVILWICLWGFLSLARLVADWDFWLDWSQYGGELALGLAVTVGIWRQTRWSKLLLITIVILFFGGWAGTLRNLEFWWPRKTLAGSVEEKLARWAAETGEKCQASPIGGGEKRERGRWFVSGTGVFWLSALCPEAWQLRGGVDEGSVNDNWRKWAWILRESQNQEEIKEVLEKTGIKWIVVHTSTSGEFYHDFKNEEVWDKVGRLVEEEEGDRLYEF